MASNVDPIVLNYSRPIISSSTTPPPRPLWSPSRARTDDESKRPKPLLTRNRARAQSLPRARAASPSSPVSSISTHAPSLIHSSNKRQRESVQSQQSSLYPPSTVTSQSAFSGPETPPSPPLPLGASLLDADDVSYRLKLLVKNNYFLPPPHVKPSPQQLSSLPTTPVKSPTLRGLFRPVKSSPKSPPVPPIPEIPVVKPRQTRPQNRVVVIRETLPDLAADPLPQSEDYFNAFEEFVDPTTDSDALLPTQRPQPPPRQSREGAQQPDWRADLLQQAVGLSLVDRPPRKESLPSEQTRGFLGQPISSLAAVTVATRDFQSRNPSDPSTTALRPPPRSIKERTKAVEETANSAGLSTTPDLIIQSPSGPSLNEDHEKNEHVDHDQDVQSQGRQTPARPSFSPSPRPSLTQTLPYSSSPFGHPPSSPPLRFSAATDHTQSTTTFQYEDHELTPFNASRPSFTASSVHSMPRPSFSESHVSHYSATFGERGRESISHYSTRSHETDGRASKRSSLAYLRGSSRSRSASPSRVRSSSPPPPMPPLPSGSDTEGHSTIIYVHPTGAISNTALSTSSHGHPRDPSPIQTSSASPRLDPKRGITNAPIPQSPSSPRFLSFMSPKLAARSLPLDIDVVLTNTMPDAPSENTGRSPLANSTTVIETWRDAQVHQEEARKFEGMVVQHIESEKDRFKRIASRGKLND